jgi:peptidoglycan/LPS O-acetylase OafA/YrhL
MAVETVGVLTLRGDTGPGVPVRVFAAERRLKLVSGGDVIGDWDVTSLGIHALQDGFAIRAAGEEFVLRSEDDPLLAEELGMVAVSPRLARRVAALHPPEEPPEPEPLEVEETRVGAIVFALGGVLVLTGGFLLRFYIVGPQPSQPGGAYQWPFMLGGAVMVAVGVAMAVEVPRSRLAALVVLGAVVVSLGFALGGSRGDTGLLTAFAFVAGGVVVAVAALAGWDWLSDEGR